MTSGIQRIAAAQAEAAAVALLPVIAAAAPTFGEPRRRWTTADIGILIGLIGLVDELENRGTASWAIWALVTALLIAWYQAHQPD